MCINVKFLSTSKGVLICTNVLFGSGLSSSMNQRLLDFELGWAIGEDDKALVEAEDLDVLDS